MNIDKRKDYKLLCSIHTLEMSTADDLNKQEELDDRVNGIHAAIKRESNTSKIIVNVNRTEKGDLYGFEEFNEVFNDFLRDWEIKDYRFQRIDMRFDNFNPEHYEEFAKLNKYLLSAMAVTYGIDNVYKTSHLFTQKQLSVAVKKYADIEAEHYNRRAKSTSTKNQKDMTESRLETRSKQKALSKYTDNDEVIKLEFQQAWFERLDQSIKHLKDAERKYNECLFEIWREDRARKKNDRRYSTDTAFINAFSDCIFSSRQLIDLYERMGKQNPKGSAKSYKNKHRIEYFNKSDVEFVVGEIKRATNEYFKKNA